MKRLLFMGAACTLFLYYACKKETVVVTTPPEDPEFVARSSDFENYRTWTLVGKTSDANPILGAATHLSNVKDAVRWTYIKNNATRGANGQFPVGTMLVKEYRKMDGDTINTFYTAMVKRGKKFNPEFGDWEWFHILNGNWF